MQRIEPTRRMAVKIWWALTWRVAAGALAAAIALGLFFGVINLALGVPQSVLDGLIALIGFPLGIAIWIEVVFRVLKVNFKEFEIALVAPQE